MVHVCTCNWLRVKMIRQGTTHDKSKINQRTECTEIQADLIYNYIQMHILFESVQAILPAYWILLVILRKRLFILITRQALTLRLKQRVGHGRLIEQIWQQLHVCCIMIIVIIMISSLKKKYF